MNPKHMRKLLGRKYSQFYSTGPCSPVGGESDCRSKGCEFDPAQSITFMKIDHEIISTVLSEGLLSETSVCAQSTG